MKKALTPWDRAKFAAAGIAYAYKTEGSIRLHSCICALELAIVVGLRAPTFWIPLLAVTCGVVIALELVNTALENAVDHLHPGRHPAIRAAKDCAAGAVLLMSLISGGLTLSYVFIHFSGRI